MSSKSFVSVRWKKKCDILSSLQKQNTHRGDSVLPLEKERVQRKYLISDFILEYFLQFCEKCTFEREHVNSFPVKINCFQGILILKFLFCCWWFWYLWSFITYARYDSSFLSRILIKGSASFCYCAYVLRISGYSSLLRNLPTNKAIFLRGLWLWKNQI